MGAPAAMARDGADLAGFGASCGMAQTGAITLVSDAWLAEGWNAMLKLLEGLADLILNAVFAVFTLAVWVAMLAIFAHWLLA